MKKLFLLLFLAIATAGYAQKAKVVKADSTSAYSLKAVPEDDEVYGRAFLMIQTSSEPSDALKKWLIDIPKKLWNEKIIIYIGVQIGKPGGCGSPGRPPC